ncbi:MAG: hypothetical protein LBD73_06835 [Deferribacteraceae bacterium]|jgi:2-dehydro-3-deoxyphosphogluconate aldolase/(4S)-4-hydroxy-2-oxoglutarate aldolase|nr:hypothetical protein [Deferribacteraceae bacterium]
MTEHGILPKFENAAQVKWLLNEGFSVGVLALAAEDALGYNALKIAREVKEKYPSFSLGISGVKRLTEAKHCAAAGVSFIIISGIDKKIILYAREKSISVYPVVYTKKDADKAISLGLDTVVYHPILLHEQTDPLDFPAETYRGINYIFYGVQHERWDLYVSKDLRCSCILNLPKTNISTFLCSALSKVIGFKFMHLGINNPDEKHGKEVAKIFGDLFFMPFSERGDAAFMGSEIEVLYKSMRGKNGHIGFSVNNMQRALAYLKRRGVGIIDETAQYDEAGVLRFVYTDLEAGGFAVHLRQL